MLTHLTNLIIVCIEKDVKKKKVVTESVLLASHTLTKNNPHHFINSVIKIIFTPTQFHTVHMIAG